MIFEGEKIKINELPSKIQDLINDLNDIEVDEGHKLNLLHAIKRNNYYSAIFESSDKVIYFILEMYHNEDFIHDFWITGDQLRLLNRLINE